MLKVSWRLLGAKGFWGALFLIAGCALPVWANAQIGLKSVGAVGAVVTTPQLQAQLLAYAPEGVGAGKTVWLGLQLSHQAQWHTYWQNSGDSGQPTDLQWSLPSGVQAGELRWPVPQKIWIGNLANYGLNP